MATQPASGTAGARIRPAVRPWTLVVVLLGLFLMHGGPAAAEGGCHGMMQATAAMGSPPARTPATTPSASSAAMAATAHAATPVSMAVRPSGHPEAAGGKAVVRADGTTGMRGALCLATTPRSEIPPPPIAATAFVLPAAVLLTWARPARDGTRRRGPPTGGRPLLLQVCVART
ncbi:hypothetical protein [Streptomyces roseochromogenus]|uniref:Uncharacterized protein n=1 Tax=Streptomyces roseochromogenus subsp. oscitans DS 12.976 TaxID=1352936 RepID=V6KCY9_STRRC|nr:hypothetical protein [Streptomyces roseochromogenus]EST29957.1 hypothetical protein M878_19580 [Streptomyces roseochromogenus subsp. oscitans DS 12.976]